MESSKRPDKHLVTPELKATLEEALKRNAGADELSSVLAAAGVDPQAAEKLVAEYQRARGAAIGAQELDDAELDQVAGGGTGIDCNGKSDCDVDFKDYRIPQEDRCYLSYYCDETLVWFQ